MKRFDPASLFDRETARCDMKDHPYPTDTAELDATRTRVKPLTRGEVVLEELVDGGLARAVLRRGLALALHGSIPSVRDRPRQATFYAARPEELWRVPAIVRLWRGVRIFVSEQPGDPYESRLLGYTKQQTARWHAHLHQHDSFCFYVLFTRVQRARIDALGRRCLGTIDDVQGFTFYYAVAPLKPDAYARVPTGLSLGRVLLNWKILRTVHDDLEAQPHQKLRAIRPTRKQARAIVENQHADVELLTARGWR